MSARSWFIANGEAEDTAAGQAGAAGILAWYTAEGLEEEVGSIADDDDDETTCAFESDED